MELSKIAKGLRSGLGAAGWTTALVVGLSGYTSGVADIGVSSGGSASIPGQVIPGGGSANAEGGVGSGLSGGAAAGSTALKPFAPAANSLHRLTRSQFQNSLTALQFSGNQHYRQNNGNLSQVLLTVANAMGANLKEIGLDVGHVTTELSGLRKTV